MNEKQRESECAIGILWLIGFVSNNFEYSLKLIFYWPYQFFFGGCKFSFSLASIWFWKFQEIQKVNKWRRKIIFLLILIIFHPKLNSILIPHSTLFFWCNFNRMCSSTFILSTVLDVLFNFYFILKAQFLKN